MACPTKPLPNIRDGGTLGVAGAGRALFQLAKMRYTLVPGCATVRNIGHDQNAGPWCVRERGAPPRLGPPDKGI